jgi:L-histidine N-alpha-methyltransferase
VEAIVDYFLTTDELEKTLQGDVVDGLARMPKTLPPKWFYDEAGSRLFEEITRLPEYYPTRCEHAILGARADEIAAVTGATSLLELGAGSAEKTNILLTAMRRNGTLRSYVPVDVSGEFLIESARRVARQYPGLSVHALVADYERHLHLIPPGGRRLIVFLGSTIGNMIPPERAAFFGFVREMMGRDDWLLLGVDLVKEPSRLVRAYDDAAGVTAAFNRNVLHVVNRTLGADFRPDAYQHVAVWDSENEWIEMRLRAVRDQEVRITATNTQVTFAIGEEIRTEVSAKFRRSGFKDELDAASLELVLWWTDPAGDFALCLTRLRS